MPGSADKFTQSAQGRLLTNLYMVAALVDRPSGHRGELAH
jgi:hypothetical protein